MLKLENNIQKIVIKPKVKGYCSISLFINIRSRYRGRYDVMYVCVTTLIYSRNKGNKFT